MMHGRGRSDSAVVALKPTNKAEPSAAEPVERRTETKGNGSQQSMLWTLCQHQHVTGAGRLRTVASRRSVWTRGGSRMRESRTYGSVRGARGNSRPYRDIKLTRPAATAFGSMERLSAWLRKFPANSLQFPAHAKKFPARAEKIPCSVA